MRVKLVAANWKMNGDLAMAEAVSKAIAAGARGSASDVVICPPSIFIPTVAPSLRGSDVSVGAQDCHSAQSGAHTGDVSARMLRELGCSYVISGHSERRAAYRETDGVVQAKAAAAHQAGVIAIVCVGESEAQRDAGNAPVTVAAQIRGSLPPGSTSENTVIAYEPVWAIGTGRTPSLDQISEMHGLMRQTVAECLSGEIAAGMRLLYGGSVNAENAEEILAVDGVDGALVGGASLKAESFLAIVRSCH